MNDLQPKTMTILELSRALMISRDLIEKRINELFPGKMKKGVKTILNEYEVTAIKIRIQENTSLATSDDRRKLVDMPKTDLEKELLIQQAMMFQAEKIQSMQLQIDTLKPKAALADKALRDEKEHYSITEAGKHLSIRQKEIFSILRMNGMLTTHNLPTQRAIDMEILQLRTNAEINGRNRPQAIMTMANMQKFQERYCR